MPKKTKKNATWLILTEIKIIPYLFCSQKSKYPLTLSEGGVQIKKVIASAAFMSANHFDKE